MLGRRLNEVSDFFGRTRKQIFRLFFGSIFTYAKVKPIPNSRFTITHKSDGFTLGAECRAMQV